ncbi:MAG: tetratricopeptide repeat protein [Bacteroidia bacterium]
MDRLAQLFSFLELDANDAFTLYSIAYEYVQSGNLAEGIVYFERLLAMHPEYVGAYYHLAKCYQRTNQPEKAAASYEKGMEIAEKKKDFHALSELKNAYLNFEMGLDDEE